MIGRCHNAEIPFVTSHGDQRFVHVRRLAGDGQIRDTGHHHVGNLLWITLVNAQTHIRITFLECFDRMRQRVLGLRVRGRKREQALIFLGELTADLLDVFNFAQHRFSAFDNDLARLRHSNKTLAVAFKDFDF